jgi:beta-L-arabinofuranosidase (glycosyl hydrolase family 127)
VVPSAAVDWRGPVRSLRAAGWWRPSTASYLLRGAVRRGSTALPSDEASLRAAAAWLARAQDATGDGGIAGRYRLAGGWSSSYPETTGYAIPTLLTLADILDDRQYRERAGRSVEFLRSVQLRSGAFPALEIADNRTEPSPFNSAQIVHGLHRWYLTTGDATVLDPITRAAHWICDVQDDDGAWRRHFYRNLACAYSAHAACWLAEVADDVGEPKFRRCAERNLRWVLQQRDPDTGWFDRAGFSEADHRARRSHTHTIAYTVAGVLRLSERLDDAEGRDAAVGAASRILERFERSKTLAAVLNHRWQPQAAYVCLTGNAQMAVIWLELARSARDLRFANAAFGAIDQVKRAQTLAHSDGGIRGGIPGSWPIGGDYIAFAFPNWAAKFFIDALVAKRECLARLREPVQPPAAAPAGARMPLGA